MIIAIKQINHGFFVEDIQAHACQTIATPTGNAVRVDPTGLHSHALDFLVGLRLFDKATNLPTIVNLHDAKCRRVFPRNRNSRNGGISPGFDVRLHHLSKIHTIQLVTRKNQHMLNPVFFQVHQIFSHSISSSLIPVSSLIDGLLSSEQLDKTTIEMIKRVSLSQMSMQAFGQELRENVCPIQSTIDAITYWNIDQSVFRS